MNYQQFVVEVKEKVEHILGENLRVEIMTTLKNNGTEKIGLSISDPDINISPTIYLEEFYNYHNNLISLEYIAQEIVSLYHEVRFDHDLEIDSIQNFQFAKHAIGYKLINASLNQELLKRAPHKICFEFAVVFFMIVDADPHNRGTILITHDLMKYWKTNIDELYEAAQKNMPTLFPVSFVPMHEMVCELLHQDDTNFFEESPLYILTNTQRTLGASTMLYNHVLPDIGRKLGESYYILPSSIHELIIVPESRCPHRDELNKMIKEVNETQILPEEMLGERAYHFDHDMKILS